MSGKRLSDIVVGAFIGVGLLWLIAVLTDPFWRRVCWVALGYEAYTLLNRWRGDTLSESVWRLSKRPLVPFLFGMAYGYGLGCGYITDPVLSGGIAFLMGHFFFQAHREDVKPRVRLQLDSRGFEESVRAMRRDLDALLDSAGLVLREDGQVAPPIPRVGE